MATTFRSYQPNPFSRNWSTKTKHRLLLLVIGIILCALGGCRSAELPVEPTFFQEDSSINLYAFIGQKVSVDELERDPAATETFIGLKGDTVVQKVFYFDQGFTASYKLERPVFNTLTQDTITFLVWEHYGRPAFEKHAYVLLYLSKSEKDGTFYHQKYQYDPVIKNENGTWSGLNGESIAELFEKKKQGVLKARGLFD